MLGAGLHWETYCPIYFTRAYIALINIWRFCQILVLRIYNSRNKQYLVICVHFQLSKYFRIFERACHQFLSSRHSAYVHGNIVTFQHDQTKFEKFVDRFRLLRLQRICRRYPHISSKMFCVRQFSFYFFILYGVEIQNFQNIASLTRELCSTICTLNVSFFSSM